jgi:hypothetical protein
LDSTSRFSASGSGFEVVEDLLAAPVMSAQVCECIQSEANSKNETMLWSACAVVGLLFAGLALVRPRHMKT